MGPLGGLRIVVTRAREQAEELAAPLRQRGAEVILLPMIAIAAPEHPEAVRATAAHLDDYDWLVFTSANAVRALASETPHAPQRARIAVVGASTRKAAEELGWRVDLVPDEFVAESLAQELAREGVAGKSVLLPKAAVTREVLTRELRALGARVDVLEVYRNIVPEEASLMVNEIFREPFPDWVTFASSSAVENTVRVAGTGALMKLKIASIGPITSKTIRKHGLAVAADASQHDVEGLIEAITRSESEP